MHLGEVEETQLEKRGKDVKRDVLLLGREGRRPER